MQVKPQYLDNILEALKPHILSSHLIISIAAGIRVSSLEAALPEGTRVVSGTDCHVNMQKLPNVHRMCALHVRPA